MPTSSSILATFVDPEGGGRVEAVTESGFSLAFDRAESREGRRGPGPMEAVLAVLAACTAMDVASILRKKRQAAHSYQIAVTGERADEHPKVYTSIVVEHRVVGPVDAEALRRSVELSATRYCPVSAMLSAGVTIEHRYRLWPEQEEGDGTSAVVAVTGPEGATLG